MNKTEKNISPRCFYQSKYSSRVWNMIQNKDLVICGIGLCRGVRIYCRFLCGEGAEQWKRVPCCAQLGPITHLTLQCCAVDAQLGSWWLLCALSTVQGCYPGPHCLHCRSQQLSTLLRSRRHLHRGIYTASTLREMFHVSLYCGEHTGKSVFIQEWACYWFDCLGVWLFSSCWSLITGVNIFWVTSGRMWDHLTGAQTGTFWPSGVKL